MSKAAGSVRAEKGVTVSSPGCTSSAEKSMLRRLTRAGVPVLKRRILKPSFASDWVRRVAGAKPEGLAAAAELRRRGRRAPLAFVARTPTHAYSAYRVDAMQYLLLPVTQQELSALLDRATEPEYGPAMTVNTAQGLRVLAYACIEYLECTHHVVHFHLTSGEDVASLSLRVPFSAVADPLLADGRFLQPHRSYVVNLKCVSLLAPGELRMESGVRIPVPRGREAAVREALTK